MIILFILNTLLYQNGDTLIFTAQDSIIDRWVLGETVQQIDSLKIRIIRKVKISPNNKFFFIHEERDPYNRPSQTKIVFYDADKNRIWEESADKDRMISFRLSNIYDSLFIVVDVDRNGYNPSLWTIKSRKKDIIIERGKWERIINYEISPNYRYLVSNTRNRYFSRIQDYIYSIDLKLKKDWHYLFPLCPTCKRVKIDLNIDNSGKVEVISKGEHRIFSKEGKFIDYFLGSE